MKESEFSKFTVQCEESNAQKYWDWIQDRGGLAIWESQNLSNPGASWITPATIRQGDCEGFTNESPDANVILPYPQPTWQAGKEPARLVIDPKQVGVYTAELYKAFRVGLVGREMSLVLTSGAQRKVDKHMAECKEKHGDSFYRKGVLEIEGASMGIYYTKTIVPLDEWIQQQKG